MNSIKLILIMIFLALFPLFSLLVSYLREKDKRKECKYCLHFVAGYEAITGRCRKKMWEVRGNDKKKCWENKEVEK